MGRILVASHFSVLLGPRRRRSLGRSLTARPPTAKARSQRLLSLVVCFVSRAALRVGSLPAKPPSLSQPCPRRRPRPRCPSPKMLQPRRRRCTPTARLQQSPTCQPPRSPLEMLALRPPLRASLNKHRPCKPPPRPSASPSRSCYTRPRRTSLDCRAGIMALLVSFLLSPFSFFIDWTPLSFSLLACFAARMIPLSAFLISLNTPRF